MANRTKFTPKKMEQFLDELRTGMSVSGAASVVGVSRRTAYDHRETNDVFASEWDDAVEEGTDLIEDEMRRRAVDGWDEPVWYQGQNVGTVRKYSDTLLIVMAKARRPEKYRDNYDVTSGGEKLSAPAVFIPAVNVDVPGFDA